jgi:hypothetical protein
MKIIVKLLRKNEDLLKKIVLDHNYNIMRYSDDEYHYSFSDMNNYFIEKLEYLVYYDESFFTPELRSRISPATYVGIEKTCVLMYSNEQDIFRYNVASVHDDNGKKFTIKKIAMSYFFSMKSAYDCLLRYMDLEYVTLLAKEEGYYNEIKD